MKRLLLFVGIVVVIGGGVLLLPQNRGNELTPPSTTIDSNKPPEIVLEPTVQVIESIIPQVLDAQFNAVGAAHQVANLDQTAGSELIVTAIEDTFDALGRPAFATIQVVTLTSETGDYEHIGKVNYQESLRGVPEIKELRDITGNGTAEIIASLMYGGAASSAEGIVIVDIPNKVVRWAQLQNAQGQIQDAIFLLAASAGHWNTVTLQNLNSNNSEEIIEIFAQRLPFEDEILCTTNVYTWNGLRFIYSEQLSQQILEKLNSECILS